MADLTVQEKVIEIVKKYFDPDGRFSREINPKTTLDVDLGADSLDVA